MLAVVTILGLGILGSSSVLANETGNTNHMSSLAQKIAEKFGLNQADVQAVFDEAHEERNVQVQEEFESRLTQYVTDGKITAEQKQLILQKRAELDAKREADRESMQNLTEDERRTKMTEEKTALETWTKENGIDIQYLMPGGRDHGGPKGFGMQRGVDENAPSATSAPTVTE